MVSHDRAFIDNVVTQTLVAEGNGRWKEYAGGYSDWLQQRPQRLNEGSPSKSNVTADAPREKSRVKLSFKEQRELAELPQQIENLEIKLKEIHARLSDPNYHKIQAAQTIKDDVKAAEDLELSMNTKFERWSHLDQKNNTLGAK